MKYVGIGRLGLRDDLWLFRSWLLLAPFHILSGHLASQPELAKDRQFLPDANDERVGASIPVTGDSAERPCLEVKLGVVR